MARNLATFFHVEATKHPQSLALTYCQDEVSERRITYRELEGEASEVARILCEGDTQGKQTEMLSLTSLKQRTQSKEVFNGKQSVVCEGLVSQGVEDQTTVIGILCSSGPEAVACILGILEKNAYLYIAPECTKRELTSLLLRVCPRKILVEEKYMKYFNEIFSDVVGSFDIFETHFKLVSLNSEKESAFKGMQVMKELAYVIPTSGSTGVPKYVYVPHRCIMPNVVDLVAMFGVGPEDCIFCAAPLTFDPSVVDLFMAFKAGAKLLMVSPQLLKIPSLLLPIMVRNKMTILQATPTLMLSFGRERLQKIFADNSHLKVLALGGEIFPKLSLIKQWLKKTCKVRIFNLYGITEVSCWASAAEVTVEEPLASSKQITTDNVKIPSSSDEQLNTLECMCTDMTPVGKALSSTIIKVLSEKGEEVGEGREGEIYIGGSERICWVDDGSVVFNDKEDSDVKTRQIQSILRPTGDRGILKNGKIYCLGRLDRQVKRSGQKVSLAEIERLCKSYTYVDACHVVLDNKDKIIAFVFSHLQEISEEVVWKDLKRNLSEWKLPDNVIVVKEVPFNKHGKVDIDQLLSTRPQSSTVNYNNFNHQSLEIFYKDLWKRIGKSKNINPRDNFIKCGGNSLNAVQFTEELGIFLGCEIPNLLDVLLNGTFLETYQLVRKYHHSRKSIDNIDNSHSETRKKIKSEYSDSQSSQDIRVKDDKESYRLYNDIPTSHSQGITQKYYSLDKEDRVPRYNSTSLTVVSRRGVNNRGTSPPKYTTVPYSVNLEWKYNLGKCIDSTPVVVEYNSAEAFVCVGSHSHKFACIDVITGTERWCVVLGGRIESSPSISRDGGYVYVGCYDGCLYCTCVEDGCIAWKFETGGEVKSSPVVDEETGCVIFGSHDKRLYCLTADGELEWSVKVSDGSIFSSPCISGDSVYVATLDGIISGVNKTTGSINWRLSVNKPVFSSLALYSK
ncbi:Beta-alanine-activating enzyme-like, partial [Homarus americanus]